MTTDASPCRRLRHTESAGGTGRAFDAGHMTGVSASPLVLVLVLLLLLGGSDLQGASTPQATAPATAEQNGAQPPQPSLTCESKPGQRTQCQADTSAGVVLLRSTGDAPCLLGRTWGYDQNSVWVSDGCSGEFGTGAAAEPQTTQPK